MAFLGAHIRRHVCTGVINSQLGDRCRDPSNRHPHAKRSKGGEGIDQQRVVVLRAPAAGALHRIDVARTTVESLPPPVRQTNPGIDPGPRSGRPFAKWKIGDVGDPTSGVGREIRIVGVDNSVRTAGELEVAASQADCVVVDVGGRNI
jgi:hypothetical protein